MGRLNEFIIMCEEGNKHFEDLSHLVEVKEQLNLLIQKPNKQHHQLYQDLFEDLQLFSDHQVPYQLLNRFFTSLNELKDTHDNEQTNKIAMAELSIKLIDYVLQMEHQNEQKVNNYQGYIDQLRTQMQYLQKKNQNIEGDVEQFRQQLRVVQDQDNQNGWQKSSEVVSVNDQNRKIWQLQEQLQKLKQELRFSTIRSASKKSLIKFNDKNLQMNRSQPYFEPASADLVMEHETLQLQEKTTLNNKISDLEYENYMLRVDLEKVKEELQNQTRQMGINPQFETEKDNEKLSFFRIQSIKTMQNPIEGGMGSYGSITCLNSHNSFNRKSFKKLLHQQSTQHFKTLSKQWSSRYLVEGQSGYEQQLKQLVFLEQIGLPDTGNTENSEHQQNVQYEDTAINTDFIEEQLIKQKEQCWCEYLNNKWSIMTGPYFNLQKRIVTSRIKTTFTAKK